MRKWKSRALASTLAVAASAGLAMTQAVTATAAQPEEPVVSNADRPVEGTYLVTLAANSQAARSAAGTERATHALVEEYGGTLDAVLTATMRGYVVEHLPERQARRLAADPGVAEVRQSGRAGIGGPGGTQQNPRNWGLDRIDQRDRPMDDSYTYPNDGEGTTVYIVDTGIRYSHQEFGGRASFGVDLDADPNGGEDCNNHGTHVSGIVGGETRGVAKAVDLVSVRVLGCDGYGEDVDVVKAAEWITKNAEQPAVANLSVYTGDPDIAVNAIRNSISSGVQWSLITGNNGGDACDYGPGGQVPSALQVGNSTSNDTRRFDSNAGRCMDLFAPGTNIDSAFRGSDSSYGTLSGTSMAAPHVAGAMALRLHDAPGSSSAQLHSWIMDNASTGKLSGLSGDTPNKLLYVPNDGSQPPGDPTAEFTASCPDESLTCTFDAANSSDPDGSISSYAWDFGDGTTGDGRTPEHTYAEKGTYSVELTVTDDEGNTDTATRQVRVGEPGGGQEPAASFTVNCQSLDCAFDATASTDPDGTITTYAWNFGDGTTGNGTTTTHTYPSQTDTYTATLTVTDNNGNTATTNRTIQCWAFGTSQGFCFSH
ncbi:subtilisin family serine protease [Amycolatopsis cihanbeyliensis]|uniref:Subtilisin family serine protease n=2 Tax=Amycolatopsis cihanbeyliensis TaxID=1128664 RepID=A0A542DHY1_AMYCI|nr:subtilisin family serine protease [Amycolatopsis cihanbeyliensis]